MRVERCCHCQGDGRCVRMVPRGWYGRGYDGYSEGLSVSYVWSLGRSIKSTFRWFTYWEAQMAFLDQAERLFPRLVSETRNIQELQVLLLVKPLDPKAQLYMKDGTASLCVSSHFEPCNLRSCVGVSETNGYFELSWAFPRSFQTMSMITVTNGTYWVAFRF